MNDSTLRRWASTAAALVAILFLAEFAGAAVNASGHPAGSAGGGGSDVLFDVLMTPFLFFGWVILRRQPRNAVGWTMLTIGFFWALGGVLSAYARFGLVTHPGAVPGAAVVEALSSPMWAPPITLTGTVLLLLFPEGRLPSPRWRLVVWLSVFAIIGASITIVFVPTTLVDDGYPGLANPLAIRSLKAVLSPLQVSILLIPVCILASAASLVSRYRRSRGIQRLQLKWLATGGAAVALIYLVAMAVSLGTSWGQADTPGWVAVIQAVASSSFVLIPAAIWIAISRYRLYEIDRIINRTLVYALLTGALAAVYAGLVLGLGQVARSAGGSAGSPIVVAASTLAAAATVRPLRRRVQTIVDRRFYRHNYDAQRTLNAFTVRLRHEIDLDPLAQHLLGAVRDTVEPTTAQLWLRPEMNP